MTITLLHTADVHHDTFNALREAHAPGLEFTHIVRPDLLARACEGVDEALIDEIGALIEAVDGPVVCTCTSLGPIVTRFGALRADAPMMQLAAEAEQDVLLVYTVAATRSSSYDLLEASIASATRRGKQPAKIHTLALTEFWPLFISGEDAAFHAAIAGAVTDALKTTPEIGVVVLAQSSMAGAAPLMSALPQTILSLPDTAMAHLARLG